LYSKIGLRDKDRERRTVAGENSEDFKLWCPERLVIILNLYLLYTPCKLSFMEKIYFVFMSCFIVLSHLLEVYYWLQVENVKAGGQVDSGVQAQSEGQRLKHTRARGAEFC